MDAGPTRSEQYGEAAILDLLVKVLPEVVEAGRRAAERPWTR